MSTVVFISGKAALANFIGEVQGDSVDRLAASDYNATRFLTNSLRNSVTDQPGATRAELFGAGYWKFVGNGRGPGKPPPLAPILKWVQAKGLASGSQAEQTAKFIRTSIGKRGTLDYQLGGKNVFTEVVREAQPKIPEVLRAFMRDLRDPVAVQFKKTFAA